MSKATQTVYVVDEDGGTWVFASDEKSEAEARLVHEAWTGAVHLTITKGEAPAELENEALVDWVIANIPPITCEVQ